jgi:hypothetical protein
VRITILVLAAALSPAMAAAQTDTVPGVPRGARVRVTQPSGAHVDGRFWYLRSDTLHLLAPKNDSVTDFALDQAPRVELNLGRRRETWSAGGVILGGLIGVLVSQLTGDDGNSTAEAGSAITSAAAGAVGGGFVGWLVAPARWRPLELRRTPSPGTADAP